MVGFYLIGIDRSSQPNAAIPLQNLNLATIPGRGYPLHPATLNSNIRELLNSWGNAFDINVDSDKSRSKGVEGIEVESIAYLVGMRRELSGIAVICSPTKLSDFLPPPPRWGRLGGGEIIVRTKRYPTAKDRIAQFG